MDRAKSTIDSGFQRSVRTEISSYTNQLVSYIDKKAMVVAYQTRRRSERLYAYNDILFDACGSCFRSTGVSGDGKRCVVWGYNGRHWCVVSPIIFSEAVGSALIACSGAGDFVVKGDWVEKKSMIMQSAYAGVCSSPLDVGAGVVGFSNGVWDFSDVRNPVFHPFSDKMPVTDLLPYPYDVTATCPLWESFLRQMLTPGDIQKLQKYLGLGVVRRRDLPHVVEDTLWLVGNGANGKTTIENVVRQVYGYQNISEASMAELLDRNQVSRMLTMASVEGKLFNICSEVDMEDISRGSDTFKRLCSGEPQNARAIGKDVHRVYDVPFLIFSMNQMPSNRRMDAAFRRRIVQIKFNRTVREEDMDSSLGKKLSAELSGIRNWMVEGYRMLVKDDFKMTHTADEEYMEGNGQYFDIFIRHEGLRANAWAGIAETTQLVSVSVLFDKYVDFCERKMYGIELPTVRQMSKDLRRLNFRSVRKASGVFYEIYCDRKLDYAI